MRNPAAKSRRTDNPYAAWTDGRTGWKYKLLKSWQGDNGREYSRWFVEVLGFGHDMGDEYVNHLIPGLFTSSDLTFDVSVWSDKNEFLLWAQGSVI